MRKRPPNNETLGAKVLQHFEADHAATLTPTIIATRFDYPIGSVRKTMSLLVRGGCVNVLARARHNVPTYGRGDPSATALRRNQPANKGADLASVWR